MNPLAKLQNLVGMFLEALQSNDPLADPPKTGPALLVSDCGLGEPVDDGEVVWEDEWKPTVDDDQGEALPPAIDWLTARVVHCNGGLWRRDDHTWQGIGHTGTCSPLPSLAAPDSPITVIFDNDGALICDLSTITSLDGDVRELLSGYLEPPVVRRWVSSLGINERDAQWVSATDVRWKWQNERWWKTDSACYGHWSAAPWGYEPVGAGPYLEYTAQPLSWCGWAVPAILEVLAEHGWRPKGTRAMYPSCRCDFVCDEEDDWREHVAPLIADRIACDPQRAMEALRNHQPDKVNR